MHFWILESLILVGIGYINLSGSLCTLTLYFCRLQNPGERVLFWSWRSRAVVLFPGRSCGGGLQLWVCQPSTGWGSLSTMAALNSQSSKCVCWWGCPVPEKNLCLPFCEVNGWRERETVEPGPAGNRAFLISACLREGPGAEKAILLSPRSWDLRGKKKKWIIHELTLADWLHHFYFNSKDLNAF